MRLEVFSRTNFMIKRSLLVSLYLSSMSISPYFKQYRESISKLISWFSGYDSQNPWNHKYGSFPNYKWDLSSKTISPVDRVNSNISFTANIAYFMLLLKNYPLGHESIIEEYPCGSDFEEK